MIDALYGDMSPCCSPGSAPRYGGRRPSLEKEGIRGTPGDDTRERDAGANPSRGRFTGP
jgi:hypothetical protein